MVEIMNLIEIYIQEVTRRLPEKKRSEVAAELKGKIESLLSENPNDDEIKAVLEQLGNPASLANGYLDRPMHLIGPRYYEVYISLLKMFLPIAFVIAFLSIFVEFFIDYQGDEAILSLIIDIFSFGIARIIEVGIQVFFWLTLVFAIMERYDQSSNRRPIIEDFPSWSVKDLKQIPKKKAISKWEVFGTLMWTTIWATVYFYANHLIGIYRSEGDELQFVTPTFNQDVLLQFWPLVAVIVLLEIILAIYKLTMKQWTKGLAVVEIVSEIIGAVFFIIILTNENVWNAAFVKEMAETFNTAPEQLEAWFQGGIVFLSLFAIAVTAFESIRKARI